MLRFREGRVDDTSIFVTLRVGWTDLRSEFLEGEDNLNVAVVIALGVVAFLFLVIEIFALFFGVRITEGIVAAVARLHRGTRAVAAGDLDTIIEIPNEDEFGDLAASFNEMTRAVKQGREDRPGQRAPDPGAGDRARASRSACCPHDEPRLAGFEVTGASIPSREIGGDYFDFLPAGRTTASASPSATSRARACRRPCSCPTCRPACTARCCTPAACPSVVGRVNDLLVRSTDPHMFATFFYGVLDTRTGVLHLHQRRAQSAPGAAGRRRIDELTTGGLLLGMLRGPGLRQQETVIWRRARSSCCTPTASPRRSGPRPTRTTPRPCSARRPWSR